MNQLTLKDFLLAEFLMAEIEGLEDAIRKHRDICAKEGITRDVDRDLYDAIVGYGGDK